MTTTRRGFFSRLATLFAGAAAAKALPAASEPVAELPPLLSFDAEQRARTRIFNPRTQQFEPLVPFVPCDDGPYHWEPPMTATEVRMRCTEMARRMREDRATFEQQHDEYLRRLSAILLPGRDA